MKDIPGWLKHTTVWLLLGAGLFLGVQAWQAQQRAARFSFSGQTLELQRAGDGHYHWPARVRGPGNGNSASMKIDFLVDTGATGTAIPGAWVKELGLPVVGSVQSNTAGGVVQGQIVLIDLQLEGGVAVERLRVAALPKLDAPLLGMDVLGKLRWTQERGVMRITVPGVGS